MKSIGRRVAEIWPFEFFCKMCEIGTVARNGHPSISFSTTYPRRNLRSHIHVEFHVGTWSYTCERRTFTCERRSFTCHMAATSVELLPFPAYTTKLATPVPSYIMPKSTTSLVCGNASHSRTGSRPTTATGGMCRELTGDTCHMRATSVELLPFPSRSMQLAISSYIRDTAVSLKLQPTSRSVKFLLSGGNASP